MKNKHHQQIDNRDAKRGRKTSLGRWMLGFITRLTILAAGTFVVYNEFARYAAIAFLVGVMSIYLILKTIGGNSQFKQRPPRRSTRMAKNEGSRVIHYENWHANST